MWYPCPFLLVGNVLVYMLLLFFSRQNTWCCSICRRKQQSSSILQPVLTQNSTDSLLDVPIADTLQRRHSDVKIGRNSGTAGTGNGSLGSGLAPPRSPELRRHSDVSPATLKDMEKVKINPYYLYTVVDTRVFIRAIAIRQRDRLWHLEGERLQSSPNNTALKSFHEEDSHPSIFINVQYSNKHIKLIVKQYFYYFVLL